MSELICGECDELVDWEFKDFVCPDCEEKFTGLFLRYKDALREIVIACPEDAIAIARKALGGDYGPSGSYGE